MSPLRLWWVSSSSRQVQVKSEVLRNRARSSFKSITMHPSLVATSLKQSESQVHWDASQSFYNVFETGWVSSLLREVQVMMQLSQDKSQVHWDTSKSCGNLSKTRQVSNPSRHVHVILQLPQDKSSVKTIEMCPSLIATSSRWVKSQVYWDASKSCCNLPETRHV